MADEEVQNEEQGAPKPRKLGVVLGLVGALGLGSGAGAVVVGPQVATRLSAPSGEEAGGGDHGGGGSHGGGGEHGEAESSAFVVENLVLNPAETKGTRFLMASVVASMDDPGAVSALSGREPEVRDRLMELLGSKTVDELSDVTQRDTLKAEIRSALNEIAAPSQVLTVFLPTFVIQ